MQTSIYQPMAMATLLADPATETDRGTGTGASSLAIMDVDSQPQLQLQLHNQTTVVIVFGLGQESIVHLAADVLGRPWMTKTEAETEIPLSTLLESENKNGGVVIGIPAQNLVKRLNLERLNTTTNNKPPFILINTHCIDNNPPPTETLTETCHYEFLFSRSASSIRFLRRDLTRFLSLILGQTRPHEELKMKNRTNFISTTFPDVRAALPNLDILSVGADAVEMRVDLLVEPSPINGNGNSTGNGNSGVVPSLNYVGQQLMLLRQHTELPIIFTTRCTKENGKFPMDDSNLFYKYLRRAIQWGVEYVDVELWLPEDIRRHLAETKGNSIIMSAFHDFSGTWKWTSPDAQRVFVESTKYADIVKMIAMVHTIEANYELEYFRSTIKEKYPCPPLLSAVNMGQMGQLSRALNTVFSPITHPLLPMIAAPGQLTAAEINEALHIMGHLPKRDMYAIGSIRSTPQSMFMEKCFNELGLPHRFRSIDCGSGRSIEAVIMQPNFGGAYANSPIPVSSSALYIPKISDAARTIGLVDTITVLDSSSSSSQDGLSHGDHQRQQPKFLAENTTWKGIRATLTSEYVPSAYKNRTAIILSNTETDAAAAIFALRSLSVGKIYTVGFKATGPLSSSVLEPFFTSMKSVPRGDNNNSNNGLSEKQQQQEPFVIVSALPPEKALLVQPLLRHYGRLSPSSSPTSSSSPKREKVYLDLTTGDRNRRKGDPVGVARRLGWRVYGIEQVNAWTTVEMLRLLVGQNVPFDFVRMASGSIL